MQFVFPQFIEKESKIIGPLTFKQFIIIGGAVSLCIFLYFNLSSLTSFFFFSAIILFVSFGLAFVKINGVPLLSFIKNVVFFTFQPKIYFWTRKRKNSFILKKNDQKNKSSSIHINNKKSNFIKKNDRFSKGYLNKLFINLEIK